VNEKIVAFARPGGAGVIGEVEVCNRITIEVDCGCWPHSSKPQWKAEIIIGPLGTAYVRMTDERAGGEAGYFRQWDRTGPITISVVKTEKG
jgi:hypothetical protein